MPQTPKSILSLDVGEKRIGLALASSEARLASPLITLENNQDFLQKLQEVVLREDVGQLVVGLPRGLDGQATQQTQFVETFAKNLDSLGLAVHFQDEALTSAKAENELRNRGVAYTKGDVDSLSATYILEDFLQEGTA